MWFLGATSGDWRGARWTRWTAATAVTAGAAYASRWVRLAIEDRPRMRRPGPPASCVPAAARDEERLADTRLWRMAEARVARRALTPFRVRPSLRRLRVLNLDHGPGG